MPDWEQFVEKHVSRRGLRGETRSEVIAELAAHLEESYDEARSRSLTEKAAVNFALQEAGDWRVLAVNIRRAKSQEGRMNRRTKTLWLPAVLSLLGASLLLMVLERLGFEPREVWVGGFAMSLYWHWLIGLPAFGAVGAYLSQRAKGSIVARLAAGLSPALVMLAVMSLILPWGLAIDGFHFFRLVAFGVGLANWVVIPAIALGIGVAPFLRQSPQVAA
jgi:hypothetical protein